MGSQFDELAKAVARGTSRRRIVRTMLGGLVGAFVASVLPSDRTEAVEAGPESAEPSVRQVPRLNQAPTRLNQAPVRLNRAPVKLTQGPAQFNQVGRVAPH